MVSYEYFDTAGSHNWVCPAGVTYIKIHCVGGGGGGGGALAGAGQGTGGGGGAYSRKNFYRVVPGTTYTVHCGSAGGGGGPEENGATGVQSYFLNGSTVICWAAPGQGGEYSTIPGSRGAPGLSSSPSAVGDVKYSGGFGGYSSYYDPNYFGGGGGGAGKTNADGNDANFYTYGTGWTLLEYSPYYNYGFGGAGGNYYLPSKDYHGEVGESGGGGGGAARPPSGGASGGIGGSGIVLLELSTGEKIFFRIV